MTNDDYENIVSSLGNSADDEEQTEHPDREIEPESTSETQEKMDLGLHEDNKGRHDLEGGSDTLGFDEDIPDSSTAGQVNDTPPDNVDSYLTRISWPGANRFDKNEQVALATVPHPIFNIRQYISGFTLVIVASALAIHYFTGATDRFLQNEMPFNIVLETDQFYIYGVIAVLIMGLCIVAWAAINRSHVWYIITNQRTWVRTGVFSKEDEGSLDHLNVNNVEEINPFPINLIGIGHIELYTASTDDREIHIKYVKNPTMWKKEIRSNMQRERQTGNAPIDE